MAHWTVHRRERLNQRDASLLHSTIGADRQSAAWTSAQEWVLGYPDRSADIIRTHDGRPIMSYWWDQFGLQFVNHLSSQRGGSHV